MLSATNAPAGTGSIQAKVYFSEKYKPFAGSPDDLIEPVIKDLRRCGLLREDDKIFVQEGNELRYANIIFVLIAQPCSRPVHRYSDEIGTAYCGRYGE